MSPIIQTSKPLNPRIPNDHYPTPPKLCKAALLTLPGHLALKPIRVLDPGAGSGAWGQAAREIMHADTNIGGIDIRDIDIPGGYTYWKPRTDFLELPDADPFYRPDLIIGNPPYQKAEEFVRKSLGMLKLGGHCLFLLRLAFLESKKRQDLYKNLPPQKVTVLVERPSFTTNRHGKAGTDSDAYGLFLWQRGLKTTTSLQWLSWR